jgi:glycosyltransferase involved in cell wall biosynthesis
MKRILIIGMHDLIGGVETFLMSYWQHIDKSKFQMDFLSIYPKLCYEDELVKGGAKIHKVSDFKKHPLKYAKELSKILKENKYDIVHINMLSMANFIPFVVAKKCKIKKIIAHAHNTGIPSNIIRKILHFTCKKIILSNANDFWACSEKAGKWMFGDDRAKIIYNAIDVKKFSFNAIARDKIRKEFSLENKFVIGHIGRFHEQKNHAFLIDVFAEVYKRDKSAVLLLVGDGELRDDIEKKVKKLGLKNGVIFAGIRADVENMYQCFDVFVLPSLFEGFGIVFIEAQCSGLPSFASDVVPLEANITGLLQHLPFDIEMWAKTILEKKNFDRVDLSEKISEAGYDIKKETLPYGI